jgi:uncharacterized protein (TIGR03067 family)
MTTRLLIALLSVVLIADANPTGDSVSEELRNMGGTWRIVEEVDDGKRLSGDQFSKNRLIFDGSGAWKVESEGKVIGEGTATIDPGAKPKTIDYTFTKGEAAGSRFVAIYELDGDSFKHCGVMKGTRPTEFSSTPGSGQILTIFHREKR